MKRRAILVIGPPRSGTSVASHVINMLGVNFGDPARFVDPEKHTFNPIFFELQSLNDLNDEVFARFGKTLGNADWIPDRADFDEATVEAFHGKIAALIEAEFRDERVIGMKDTRFCFLLPLWEQVLDRLGFEVSYVLVRRRAHPTFASNQSLNRYSDAVNFRLIAQATLTARHFLEGREFAVVGYEQLLQEPEQVVAQLCTHLKLEPARVGAASGVIRTDLNHEAQFSAPPLYTYFSTVIDAPSWSPKEYFAYREILEAAREGESEKRLALETAFLDRDARNAALSREAEDLRAALLGLKDESAARAERIAQLDAAIAEREGVITRLTVASADLDAQLREMMRDLAERDGLNASLGQALRELDEKIASTMNEARLREERITDLEKTISDREHAIEQIHAREVREDAISWRLPKPKHAARVIAGLIAGLLRPRGGAGLFSHGSVQAAVDWPPSRHVTVVREPCFVSGWAANFETHSCVSVRVVVGGVRHEVQARRRADVAQAYAAPVLPEETGFAARLDLALGLHLLVVEVETAYGQWVPVRRTRLLRLPPKGRQPFSRSVTAGGQPQQLHFAHGPLRATVDWPPQRHFSVVPRRCVISGWAAHLDTGSSARVRVVLGNQSHETDAVDRPDVKAAFSGQCNLDLKTGFSAELELPIGLHVVQVDVELPEGGWAPLRRAKLLRLFGDHGKPFRHPFKNRRKPSNEPFVHGAVVANVDWPPNQGVVVVKELCVVSGWAANLKSGSAVRIRVIAGRSTREPEPRDRLDVQQTYAEECDLPTDTGFASELRLPIGLHSVSVEAEVEHDQWVQLRRVLLLRLPVVTRKKAKGAKQSDKPFAIGSILAHVDWPPAERLWILSHPCVVSGWSVDLEARSPAAVRVRVGDMIQNPEPRDRADVTGTFFAYSSLPVGTGFAAELDLPLGIHEVVVEAQVANGRWLPIRRARLLRVPRVFGKAFWRRAGSRAADQPFVLGSLVVHIDQPQVGRVSIAPHSCVVSGWGVDVKGHSAARVRVVLGRDIIQPYAMAREDVQTAFGPSSALPLETGFKALLSLPLGIHRMRVEVETPTRGWVTVRRTILARLPFMKGGVRRNTGISYSAFHRRECRRLETELPDIRRHIGVMIAKPSFTVLIDARGAGGALTRTLRSIAGQWYPAAEVCLVGDERAERAAHATFPVRRVAELALKQCQGDFAVLLESGELLSPNALYEFASAIQQNPAADLIYGDEDFINAWGRHAHAFHKPDWSPDYLETFNYIGFTACFRQAIARRFEPAISRYDFSLRFTEQAKEVVHIEQVLGTSRMQRRTKGVVPASAAKLDIAALEGRLRRSGRAGTVLEHQKYPGCYEVSLRLARTPRVSVIIPTAGKTIALGERRIDLIVNVVTQLRRQTHYPDMEIVVIDNGDLAAEQVQILAEFDCVRTTFEEPVFNIAKKLNQGAALATGELLLILNDDIEILDTGWVARMVEQFEKPHVGVVGGKLLYPDGLTQHVGVVHNGGNPDHVRRLRPRDEAGYFFSTCGARNYSAVTGACMMTPATLYRAVGGYSEELAVSFNDVDYCFKVCERGLCIVYAPAVELIHMESQSRIAFADPGEVAWFHERWAADLVTDRYYNEHFLTVAPPTFEPSVNRRLI